MLTCSEVHIALTNHVKYFSVDERRDAVSCLNIIPAKNFQPFNENAIHHRIQDALSGINIRKVSSLRALADSILRDRDHGAHLRCGGWQKSYRELSSSYSASLSSCAIASPPDSFHWP